MVVLYLTSQCSKLEPKLPEAEQFEVMKISTDHLMAVPLPDNQKKKMSPEAIKVELSPFRLYVYEGPTVYVCITYVCVCMQNGFFKRIA